MAFILDERSKTLLAKLHPDLRRVVNAAALETFPTFLTFRVTETVRTIARQKQLVASGASQTMNSRHIPGANGFAHAVDLVALVNGKVRWDWPLYRSLAAAMKTVAVKEKVPIEWGGDWKSFKDGPHFQLPWNKYPGTKGT